MEHNVHYPDRQPLSLREITQELLKGQRQTHELLQKILHNQERLLTMTKTVTDELTQLTTTVTAVKNADAAMLTFIQGVPALVTAAVQAALAAGNLNDAQVAAFYDLNQQLNDGAASVLAGIKAGTPNPLTITGTPATSAPLNQAYSFVPQVTGQKAGSTLSFSIANGPSWATFDATTGTLSGTPTAAESDTNVTISVSDGTNNTSLPPFNLSAA